MAPRWVLQTPPPLLSVTMAITKLSHTTDTSDHALNFFGSFELMEVGSSAKTIRIPTALPISKKPYHKAMVTDIFSRKIKALALESDFFSVDLVATIATYFDFNTGSTESESATVADTIYDAVFRVENLINLGFRNQYGTHIHCHPNEPRSANLSYITLFALRCGPQLLTVEDRTTSFLLILF